MVAKTCKESSSRRMNAEGNVELQVAYPDWHSLLANRLTPSREAREDSMAQCDLVLVQFTYDPDFYFII